MKTRTLKRILLIIIFLSFATGINSTPLLPLGQIETEFLYDRFERVQTSNGGQFDFQVGPYELDKSDFDIAPLDFFNQEHSQKLTLFGFAGENYTAIHRNSSNSFESFRGGLTAHPFEKLFIYGNFVLDEKRADNPYYTGKKWRGLAGDVEQAFGHYNTDRFNLTLGRFSSFWGPRESLVLSSNIALDGVAYSLNWGKLKLTYQLSRLDGLNPDEDSVLQFENRYFAGHRLDIHFNEQLRVGLFETVIFGGPGRQIELYYLNPIIFFHGSQLNEGVDDNTFVGLDFDYMPAHRLRVYGQFLIDDLQIEKKTQGDQEPNEIGLLIGTHWLNAIAEFDIKASYTRVTNRTYNQGNERNRYLHNGELLSSALGNDYDKWSLSFIRWINSNLKAGANLVHTRRGEGQVTDAWDTPWLNVSGAYDEPFPTGTVEHTSRFSLSFSGFFGKYLFFDLESGFDLIRNYRNTGGDDRSLPFISLKLSTFFSGAIDVN